MSEGLLSSRTGEGEKSLNNSTHSLPLKRENLGERLALQREEKIRRGGELAGSDGKFTERKRLKAGEFRAQGEKKGEQGGTCQNPKSSSWLKERKRWHGKI